MSRKPSIFVIAFLLIAVLLSACSGSGSAATQSGNNLPSTGSGTQAAQLPAGSIPINGAGATFPFPLYSRWFYDYAFVDPSVKFNYQSIGSGGGIKQITDKTVDFGASDAILSDEQLSAAP